MSRYFILRQGSNAVDTAVPLAGACSSLPGAGNMVAEDL